LSTKRIKLVVAYDGTDFCGWAPQAGQRSVQGTLTEAVRRISGEDCEIIGASRTDAGAHAMAQVCHFDCEVNIPEHGWLRALNDAMPSDLAVQSAEFAEDAFHSRFSARSRFYRYRILNGTRNPILDRFSHHEWRDLNLESMKDAAQNLLGRLDFRGFTAELQPWIVNTHREIYKIEIHRKGSETSLDITGTAFMRGMMRRIAGGLMEVGIGKRPPEDLKSLTTEEGMAKLELPVVLPAKGLMLMQVNYGKRLRDIRYETDGEDE
jgi:tRNA pseudouridine38-40 synthase